VISLGLEGLRIRDGVTTEPALPLNLVVLEPANQQSLGVCEIKSLLRACAHGTNDSILFQRAHHAVNGMRPELKLACGLVDREFVMGSRLWLCSTSEQPEQGQCAFLRKGVGQWRVGGGWQELRTGPLSNRIGYTLNIG
jgi:hypothetical protein